MKTLTYSLLFLLITMFETADAQSVHGFRAGVGYGSSFYSVKKLGLITNFSYYPTNLLFTEDKKELVKFIEHAWLIDEALTIGLGFSHNSFTMKNLKASPEAREAKFRQAAITFRTEYAWLRKTQLKLYSSVNLGFQFTKQYEIDMFDDNGSITRAHHIKYTDFAMHLNPVGISVGKKIGGFLELGVGFKGVISGGLYMRL
jgi:hypothetical protein